MGDIVHDISAGNQVIQVREAFNDNSWQAQCGNELTHNDKMEIQKMDRFLDADKEDQCVWTCSFDGSFTLKTAWEGIKDKKNVLGSFKFIWHSSVPLKWSFVSWRALQNSLPLDDFLVRKGFQLASKCDCCTDSKRENFSCVCLKSYC